MYCFPATRQNTLSVNMIDQQNNSPNGQNRELFLTYCVMEKLLSLSVDTKILLPDFRRWALTDVDYRGNVFPDPTNHSVDALLSLKVNCNSASSQLTLRPTRASYPKRLSSFGTTGSSTCGVHGCPQLVSFRLMSCKLVLKQIM